MKTFNRSFFSAVIIAISMFFVLNVSQIEAACSVAPDRVSYNNGDTVSVSATNDVGGDWAVCIYSGGLINGGENLPIGRSVSNSETTKTATAVVNTSTDYSGWKAVVMPGNACNSTYNADSVLCETPIAAAGTAAPADGSTDGEETDDGNNRAIEPTNTTTTIENPLNTDDFTQLVTNFLQWLLGIAGSIALLMLIYGGVIYITSIGDQQKMESGKRIVTWTLFGLIIILVSFSIVKVVEDIFVN